ncbi:MAG: Permease of the drug/metabolite transporter superfamily [Acidobacteria bacterium]|jgi:drug/metabolite transporter (DMT)-like permease|nr:Permease of the drug/metabolite transporter superfamily [Acidobacteriota bacterium]
MSKSSVPESLPPHIALLVVQLTFGTLPVVGKIVLKTIPSFALVGFRIGITALALYLVQRYRGNLRLADKKDYLKFAILSLFGVTLNQIFFITGLSLTKASNASLLAVTIPIFALSFGAVSGIEKISKIKTAGIVIAALGVVLLIDPRKASFSSDTTLGDILIIINSISYGIYVSISKDIITRNGAIKSIVWVFIFSSIVCVPLGLNSLASIDLSAVSLSTWLLILYVAVVATLIPYLFNAWALARVNPSTVAVYVYLQPLFGFLAAIVFLGEKVDSKVLAAALLIFAGLFLVTKKFESGLKQ